MYNSELILKELREMKKEMAEMKTEFTERFEALEEGQEEIRTACNVLIDWAEKASEARDLPLPKIS